MGIGMRGVPLRCPYHLYIKKNKSVSCFSCLQTYYTRRYLLETVQGYVILKAATFETGHGFALGHNPGAPSPFVTWQFTEGENGHRDYPTHAPGAGRKTA